MERLSRRRFLEDSLAALATAAAAPAVLAETTAATARRAAPSEQLRIAVIGLHGRGMEHVRGYLAMDDVTIAAICDCDTAQFDKANKAITAKGGKAPKTYQDIRKLLEDKEIDAVSIATPNHWHALAAIWAMQAGKDVYVEKPISHEVAEGRRMIEASRKYNRICQAGTQSRASKGLQEAMEYLHQGNLGKISVARGLCYKPRKSIGKVSSETPVPATVDYDLWLGPAPKKPVMREQFHYDWHWFWDYGNGDLGNQGVHEIDKALWGLNKTMMPNHVMAVGGRFGYVDDGETPNTEIAVFDYGDCQLVFEVRGLETPGVRPVQHDGVGAAKVGNIFYGEKGAMLVPNYSDAIVYDNDGNKVKEFKGGGNHFRNFVEAVRSRKSDKLFCDISVGHVSSALCHLSGISYRLGKKEPFNMKTKSFGDNSEAYNTLGRFEEHLAANGVNLKEADYHVGRHLTIDPKTETCGKDSAANAMLTRDYRAGYVVPAKI